GANEGMKEFLTRIEAAVAAAKSKGHVTPELESLEGVAYRAAMMNEKALACQERALAVLPDDLGAAYERIILGVPELGRHPEWIQGRIRPAMAALGDSPEGRTLFAVDALSAANHDAAREALEQVVAKDPTRVEAWELLARACVPPVKATVTPREREEACRRAEEALGRALKQDRGFVPFWTSRASLRLELAGILGETGRDPILSFQGAEDDLSQAIRLQPRGSMLVDRAETRTLYAVHRASLGENPQKGFEEAAADLDQAAKLDPKDPSILVGRSFTLRSRADYRVARGESPLKDLEDLETLAVAANKEGPLPSETWLNIALVWKDQALYRGGLGEDPSSDFTRAEEAFEKFADPNPLERNEKRARMRVLRARLRPRQESDAAMRDVEQALQDLSIFSGVRIPYDDFGVTRAMARRTKATLMVACGQDPSELFQGARADLDQVVESNPVSSEASAESGHLELAWGRFRTKLHDRSGALDHYGRAVRSFEEAIRSNDTLATPLREWLREARRGMLGAY
ncbi:MAG TPA: hypothetical protein VE981_17460, partial [Planctomycetota bacterium]|nr:hypothetical protein [Planctomycetota bacterium]